MEPNPWRAHFGPVARWVLNRPQNQGTVLFLAASDGGHNGDPLDDTYTDPANISTITSSVIFPKDAAVYVYDGTQFSAQTLQYTSSSKKSSNIRRATIPEPSTGRRHAGIPPMEIRYPSLLFLLAA